MQRIIENNIIKTSKSKTVFEPLILDLKKQKDSSLLKKILKRYPDYQVIDDYIEQLRELYAVKNPKLVYTPSFEKNFNIYFQNLQKQFPLWLQGKWIFYPWLFTLVHVLNDLDFQTVRFARNRNLINNEEQKKYYSSSIGIGGLSVGNSVALAIALQGGGKHFRLADFDNLALSNMNRVRAGIQNLGLNKAIITARQIFEINPYSKIEIFPEGLNKKNLKKFFDGTPKLNIMIDELDNLGIKFLIRQYAKTRKVAVVMAADNGDNSVMDIERYDLNPKTKFFHGRMGKVSYKYLKNLNKFGIGKTITQHIGAKNVTKRVQESLLEIGKTLVSWPQLGGAAQLNGAVVAFVVRKILNGQPIENNRALISLDEKLIPKFNSPQAIKIRNKNATKFKKIFGL